MQYNLVAVSNNQAVNLWTKLKFETVCKIPKDFKPPEKDYVDALVMYKWFWILKCFVHFCGNTLDHSRSTITVGLSLTLSLQRRRDKASGNS